MFVMMMMMMTVIKMMTTMMMMMMIVMMMMMMMTIIIYAGMSLLSFINHPIAVQANLTQSEVAALRLYTGMM